MIRFVISAPTEKDAFEIASEQLASFFQTDVTKRHVMDPFHITNIVGIMDMPTMWANMPEGQLDSRTLILVPLKLKSGRGPRWLAAVNKE